MPRITALIVTSILALSLTQGGDASARAAKPTPRTPESAGQGMVRPAMTRVELRGEWFYVDGEPFLIKGVGYSPYRPGQVPWKDQVSLAVMERDFQRIVAAGFNTIRTWSPLSPEALTLAERYGLMVLQGIWVEPGGNYTSPAFQEAMLETIANSVERAKGHHNILAFLIGNELSPSSVSQTGIPETESFLKRAAQTVKAHDPSRFVSYANWPSLSFLDSSMWDAISFNLYSYEPPSVAYSFGFRGYVEHLKRTVAHSKPLIVTELGLSVSPVGGGQSPKGPPVDAEALARLLAPALSPHARTTIEAAEASLRGALLLGGPDFMRR